MFQGLGKACKGHWNLRKAQVASVPEEVLTGAPGEIFFINISIRNDMDWSWKPNASLLSHFSEATALLLEEVAIPIDFPVHAGQTFKLSIPVKIRDSAVLTEFTSQPHHTAEFGFQNEKGKPFGQPIEVKFAITQKVDELQLYQNAIELFETEQTGATFEEIVQALTKTGNKAEKAKAYLAQAKNAAAAKEEKK